MLITWCNEAVYYEAKTAFFTASDDVGGRICVEVRVMPKIGVN